MMMKMLDFNFEIGFSKGDHCLNKEWIELDVMRDARRTQVCVYIVSGKRKEKKHAY